MKPRTPLYIVCSPRPGVGKTMVARLLIEFFIADRRYVEGFDVHATGLTLADYLPACTTRVSIGDTQGQMALFDRLVRDDQAPKVVDLGHAEFERFFTILAEIGFPDEARRQNLKPIILFIANPDPASVIAYEAIERRLPGGIVVPVHNEGVARASQTRGKFPAAGPTSLPLRIPPLAGALADLAGEPGFSFSDFKLRRKYGISESSQAELDSWMKRIWLEFRELELRLLLEDLRHSLVG